MISSFVNSLKLSTYRDTVLSRFADRDLLMRHFGGGVGHINNTVLPSVDVLSEMDDVESGSDSEEEAVGDSESMNAPIDSDLPQEMDTDERDEEMAEADNDDDLEDMYMDEDTEVTEPVNDHEEAVCSDDDGYASM